MADKTLKEGLGEGLGSAGRGLLGGGAGQGGPGIQSINTAGRIAGQPVGDDGTPAYRRTLATAVPPAPSYVSPDQYNLPDDVRNMRLAMQAQRGGGSEFYDYPAPEDQMERRRRLPLFAPRPTFSRYQ